MQIRNLKDIVIVCCIIKAMMQKQERMRKMAVTTVTKDNFEAEVLESKKPVLIDFWATWCGPCRMQGPVLDEIAAETDAIKIGKVNVDEEQMLALKFGITSIPTLMLFKDGKEADKLVGLRSKEELKQILGL